jgi:starch-binding outer membrane protein, SusD/RagB family
MNKLLIISGLILSLGAALTGCKKELEVSPRQSIELSTGFTSRENINAGILGVYSRLKNNRLYGRDLITHPEALSDNGFATNKSGRLINEANNVATAHFLNWQLDYFAIADINLILEAIPQLNVTPVVTPAERNNWEGQLLFLRALCYFDLARTYAYEPGVAVSGLDRGGVPVVLKTATTTNGAAGNIPTRAKVDTVYAQIYRDLTAATTQLTNNFGSSVYPQLATQVAAQALFSRVALYRKDYATCKQYADLAIAAVGSRLMTAAGYVNGWRTAINPESIFELRFINAAENIGVNESLQTSFTTLVVPGNTGLLGGFGDLVPQTTLLTDLGITATFAGGTISARTDDVRNLLYEQGSAGRGTARVECTKYLGKSGIQNLDNIPLIRVAELYLNRAEAMATIGSAVFDEAAARNDLIRIKQNRYSNYATTQQTFDNGLLGVALFNEVIKQRRLELAFEGHRFFDLKRRGVDIIKTAPYSTLLYNDFRVLANIPTRELQPLQHSCSAVVLKTMMWFGTKLRLNLTLQLTQQNLVVCLTHW